MRGHGPWSKAARAALTARAMSPGVEEGAVPIRSSLAGETTSIMSSVSGLTILPPMNRCSRTRIGVWMVAGADTACLLVVDGPPRHGRGPRFAVVGPDCGPPGGNVASMDQR